MATQIHAQLLVLVLLLLLTWQAQLCTSLEPASYYTPIQLAGGGRAPEAAAELVSPARARASSGISTAVLQQAQDTIAVVGQNAAGPGVYAYVYVGANADPRGPWVGNVERIELAPPTPTAEYSNFGRCVSLAEGPLVLVTEVTVQASDRPRAFLYTPQVVSNPRGPWKLVQELPLPSLGPVALTHCAIHNGTIALSDEGANTPAGAVLLLNSSDPGDVMAPWSYMGQLPAPSNSDPRFGSYLSLADTLLAVSTASAPPYLGRVHLYNLAATDPATWQPTTTIVNPTGDAQQWFGQSVTTSADGQQVVVTSRLNAGYSGSCYVYTLANTPGVWLLEAILLQSELQPPFNELGFFGQSASLFDDMLAVGMVGGVALYQRFRQPKPGLPAAYAWELLATLQVDDGIAYGQQISFGLYLSFHNRFLVVSATGMDVKGVAQAGGVFVYVVPRPAGVAETLFASPTTLTRSRTFGASVAWSSDLLVVGDTNGARGTEFGGKVYVYTAAPGGQGWLLQQALAHEASDMKDNLYGAAIAIDGFTLVVGGPGTDNDIVEWLAPPLSGNLQASWQRRVVYQPTDKGRVYCGSAVAWRAGVALVGCPGVSPDPLSDQQPRAGYVAVAVQSKQTLSFTSNVQLRPPSDAAGDHYGAALALGTIVAAVGAPSNNATGFVELYDPTNWGLVATIVSPVSESATRFGEALAVHTPSSAAGGAGGLPGLPTEQLIVVGAPREGELGAVHVYKYLPVVHTVSLVTTLNPVAGLLPGSRFGTAVSLVQGWLYVGVMAKLDAACATSAAAGARAAVDVYRFDDAVAAATVQGGPASTAALYLARVTPRTPTGAETSSHVAVAARGSMLVVGSTTPEDGDNRGAATIVDVDTAFAVPPSTSLFNAMLDAGCLDSTALVTLPLVLPSGVVEGPSAAPLAVSQPCVITGQGGSTLVSVNHIAAAPVFSLTSPYFALVQLTVQGPFATLEGGGTPQITPSGAAAGIVQALAPSPTSVATVFIYRATMQHGGGVRGGAIAIAGSVTALLVESSFRNNTAIIGGAVHASAGATVVVSGCTLTHNYAHSRGGALAAESSILQLHSSLSGGSMRRVVLADNTAGVSGGAIYVGFLGSFQCNGCDIARNTAGLDGGGIMLDGTPGVMLLSTLTNNVCLGDGGAVNIDVSGSGTKSTFTSVQFVGNCAGSHGGGVFARQSDLVLASAHMEANMAGTPHTVLTCAALALVQVSNPRSLSVTVTAKDAPIRSAATVATSCGAIGDGAVGTGGAVWTLNSELELRNSVVRGNLAKSLGAGIAAVSSTVTMDGLVVTANTARCGGGVACWGDGTLRMNNTKLVANAAVASGGAVSIIDCSVNITASTLQHNNASSGFGGAAFVHASRVVQRGEASLSADGLVTASLEDTRRRRLLDGSGMDVAVESPFGGDTVAFLHTSIVGNMAPFGGGIFVISDLDNVTCVSSAITCAHDPGGFAGAGGVVGLGVGAVVSGNQATVRGADVLWTNRPPRGVSAAQLEAAASVGSVASTAVQLGFCDKAVPPPLDPPPASGKPMAPPCVQLFDAYLNPATVPTAGQGILVSVRHAVATAAGASSVGVIGPSLLPLPFNGTLHITRATGLSLLGPPGAALVMQFTTQPPLGIHPLEYQLSLAVCPAGTQASGVECVPCSAGTFSSTAGSTCSPCAAGTVAPQPGATACVACGTGQRSLGSTCELCPDRTYAGPGGDCIACPREGVECTLGILRILPGFWLPQLVAGQGASVNTNGNASAAFVVDNTTILYECPPNLCIASQNGTGVECAHGRTGPLCAVCVEGWVPSGAECAPCVNKGLNWLATVVFAIMLLFWVTFTIVSSARLWQKMGQSKSIVVSSIKIAINYIQVTAIMQDVDVPWPAFVRDVLWSPAASSSSLPISSGFAQCTLRLDYYTSLSLALALPVAVALLLLVIPATILLRACCTKGRPEPSATLSRDQRVAQASHGSRATGDAGAGAGADTNGAAGSVQAAVLDVQSGKASTEVASTPAAAVAPSTSTTALAWGTYQTAVLVVWYLCYPFVVKQTTSVLKCSSDVLGLQYLTADYSIQCGTAAHARAVAAAVAVLLVFALGFPVLAYVSMRRNRQRLHTVQVARRLLFLYHGYKKRYYYWELAILLRKALVVVVTATVQRGNGYQVTAALLIIGVCLVLHVATQPFDNPVETKLETVSLSASALTLWIGLVFVQGEPLSEAMRVLLVALLCVINFGALLALLWGLCGGSACARRCRARRGIIRASAPATATPQAVELRKASHVPGGELVLNPLRRASNAPTMGGKRGTQHT